MIDREQISEALAGLDPQDREILDYSLRRRVPDADLATIFASSTSEVARRRAAAIESLSKQLGVERGADLGDLLKALLESDTWAGVGGAPAAEAHEQTPAAKESTGHRPLGAIDNPDPPETPTGDSRAPVLGMLSESGGTGSGGRKTGRRVLIGLGAAIAVLVPAGVVAALTTGDQGSTKHLAEGSAIGTFKPQADKGAEPFPTDPQSVNQYPTARVVRTTALYSAPGAKRVRLRVSPRTEWDSPRILSVVQRRGHWLAVLVPQLKNGQRAWVRDDKVGPLSVVDWSVTADLSKRRILVRHNGKTVRKVRIGVGRVDHSTPTGRFAVTDKLRVTDPSSPYGCCVLALTGHQTRLPPGWPGGDRLAIHGTHDLTGLGHAVSLGCMRTDPRDTSWMLVRIPLGTPVFIHA